MITRKIAGLRVEQYTMEMFGQVYYRVYKPRFLGWRLIKRFTFIRTAIWVTGVAAARRFGVAPATDREYGYIDRYKWIFTEIPI